MKTPAIHPLSAALSDEKKAETQLAAARQKREAAEAIAQEWRTRLKDLEKHKANMAFARGNPVKFAIQFDPSLKDQGDVMLKNWLRINEACEYEAGQLPFTLSIFNFMQAGDFSVLIRARTLRDALKECQQFQELKAQAETFAAARADELAGQLAAKAAELAAWGETHGAPADELAEVRAHL